MPLDLLKEEQGRITAELANAGAALANTEIHWETLEANLRMALTLAAHIGDAYRLAKPATRRHLNQAILERVEVDVDDQIASVQLAEPFMTILDRSLMSRLEQELNPQASPEGGGLTTIKLVEVKGLEPSASTLRT